MIPNACQAKQAAADVTRRLYPRWAAAPIIGGDARRSPNCPKGQ
jgi:hypothetical protein